MLLGLPGETNQQHLELSAAFETGNTIFETMCWLEAGNIKERARRRNGKAVKQRNGNQETVETDRKTIRRFRVIAQGPLLPLAARKVVPRRLLPATSQRWLPYRSAP